MYISDIFLNDNFIITKIDSMPYIKFKNINSFVYINYYLISDIALDKHMQFFITGKLSFINSYPILTPKRIVAID